MVFFGSTEVRLRSTLEYRSLYNLIAEKKEKRKRISILRVFTSRVFCVIDNTSFNKFDFFDRFFFFNYISVDGTGWSYPRIVFLFRIKNYRIPFNFTAVSNRPFFFFIKNKKKIRLLCYYFAIFAHSVLNTILKHLKKKVNNSIVDSKPVTIRKKRKKEKMV